MQDWWIAEQDAHAQGIPGDPNIKPPTLSKLTPHTSDKVSSILADLQSQDWGPANTGPAPNRLPANYKPSPIGKTFGITPGTPAPKTKGEASDLITKMRNEKD